MNVGKGIVLLAYAVVLVSVGLVSIDAVQAAVHGRSIPLIDYAMYCGLFALSLALGVLYNAQHQD